MKGIITFVKGDITKQDTEAIVNAANPKLMGGGGVDGAIHKAGGHVIDEECERIREVKGGCKPGEAVITSGGNLKAKYVIHAVGPIWNGGELGEDRILENAYRSSLTLAERSGIKTISFPSISTGTYGFPTNRAARIAVHTVAHYMPQSSIQEVRFVLYTDGDLEIYKLAYKALTP